MYRQNEKDKKNKSNNQKRREKETERKVTLPGCVQNDPISPVQDPVDKKKEALTLSWEQESNKTTHVFMNKYKNPTINHISFTTQKSMN